MQKDDEMVQKLNENDARYWFKDVVDDLLGNKRANNIIKSKLLRNITMF